MNRAEAQQWMVDRDKSLRADNFGRGRVVLVRHRDGSLIHLRHAFLERRGDWLAVFAEHFSPILFYAGDVSVAAQGSVDGQAEIYPEVGSAERARLELALGKIMEESSETEAYLRKEALLYFEAFKARLEARDKTEAEADVESKGVTNE